MELFRPLGEKYNWCKKFWENSWNFKSLINYFYYFIFLIFLAKKYHWCHFERKNTIDPRFLLETDHQAIKKLKSKLEFGSAGIQRWFSRLINFKFRILHKKGSEFIQAEASSRSSSKNPEEDEEDDVFKLVMQIHTKNDHLKNLKEKLKEKDIGIRKKNLIKLLKMFDLCKERQ